MSEVALWEKLRPVFVALGLDPVRVENAVANGCPDVNYTRGWVELKDEPEWPSQPSTPVRFRKLEEESGRSQCAWLLRRWASGGLCWLLVRVGSDLLMFRGCDAYLVRRGLPRADLERLAQWACLGPRVDPEHREALGMLLTGDVGE